MESNQYIFDDYLTYTASELDNILAVFCEMQKKTPSIISIKCPEAKSIFLPSIKKSESLNIVKRVLVSGNLIADALLDRPVGHIEDAEFLLDLVNSQQIRCYITEKDLENIWYLSEKIQGIEKAKNIFKKLTKHFEILKIDRELIYEASQSKLSNLDHALSVACFKRAKLDAIITINHEPELIELTRNLEKVNIINISELLDWLEYSDISNNYEHSKKNILETSNKQTEIERSLRLILAQRNLDYKVDDKSESQQLTIGGWSLEDFNIYISKDNHAKATVTLWNPSLSKIIIESDYSEGGIQAICKALNKGLKQALGKSISKGLYHLHLLEVQSTSKNFNSSINAKIILKLKNNYYQGENTNPDSTKAIFYACFQAMSKMYWKELEKTIIIKKHNDPNSSFVNSQFQAINNELKKISSDPNLITLSTFSQLVEKIDLSELLIEDIELELNQGSRKFLLMEDNLTVYIIVWKPGKIAARHHHGNSLDAIRVIKGKMTHWTFPELNPENSQSLMSNSFDEFPAVEIAKPGEEFNSSSKPIFIDRWNYHQLGNQSTEVLVTIHFRFGKSPDDEHWITNSEEDQSGVIIISTT